MKAYVCGGSMSILVNGSPTKEINIQRGLKQGDHLAPFFLFLVVVEGFSGLMRNAVSLHLYEGFRFAGSEVEVSHLQYADDTLCVSTPTVENLWTLKALLQGFEKASGLKVNFVKNCLIGVKVQTEFMKMACNFFFPFKYLGLPVGENHRRCSTWQPLIDLFDRKLNLWRNKYISCGGKIVLINSILNSIPIFYLSFMKMSAWCGRRLFACKESFYGVVLVVGGRLVG